MIDADTLEPVAPSFHVGHGVLRLFASPDGRTAIALTDEPGFALIDIVDRRVLLERAIERDPMLGLGYPGGPHIDRLAKDGHPERACFPKSLIPP